MLSLVRHHLASGCERKFAVFSQTMKMVRSSVPRTRWETEKIEIFHNVKRVIVSVETKIIWQK